MTLPIPSYPSPPSSRPASPSSAAQEKNGDHTVSSSAEGNEEGPIPLSARLDALLESYLELLHTYTTLRAHLSNDFSSGFLALAQANRTSTLGPGRRYGEEGFDERMKAFKTVEISSEDEVGISAPNEGSLRGPSAEPIDEDDHQHKDRHKHKHKLRSISIHNTQAMAAPNENTPHNREFHGLQPQTSPASSLTRLPSHHSASGPTPTHSYSYTITSPDATTDDTDPSPRCKSRDPLRWYGILNPPHLRQCQAHFTTSITSTIPDLLSTVSSLAALEKDIWLLRRELGILDEYAYIEHPTTSITTNNGGVKPVDPDLPVLSPPKAPGVLNQKHEQRRTSSSANKIKSTPPSSTGIGEAETGTGSGSGLSMRPPSEPRSRVLKLE